MKLCRYPAAPTALSRYKKQAAAVSAYHSDKHQLKYIHNSQHVDAALTMLCRPAQQQQQYSKN